MGGGRRGEVVKGESVKMEKNGDYVKVNVGLFCISEFFDTE